ncbi:MAG: peptidoglycan-binding protein [Acidobacteria bacterium]|nr:peptidoglycan-binding protein [Acidobacteriota bacterium]
MPLNIQQSVGLNGVNRPADVRAVKSKLIELGFNWLNPDTIMGPATIKAIMLFQAIKNGFNRVNDSANDGRIDVGRDTHKWLEALNAPRWQQMPRGSIAEGFINDELIDTSDNHDFGTDWLADTLRAAGASYRDDFLSIHPEAALIHVNDISMPRGGDTPHHETHECGLCFDIRLPRKDGQAGGITINHPLYDREAMRAIIASLRKQKLAKLVLLGDEEQVDQVFCIFDARHRDHAHFNISPPVRL